MPDMRSRRRSDRRAAMVLVSAVVASLPACTDRPEQREIGSEAADIRGSGQLTASYDGPYTAEFHTNIEAYVGRQVTVEAAVERILSPIAFTVIGPGGEGVEPILVISQRELADLQPGQVVVVTAVAEDEFQLSGLEEELDADLPDESYEEWEDRPYLRGSAVATSSPTG